MLPGATEAKNCGKAKSMLMYSIYISIPIQLNNSINKIYLIVTLIDGNI